METELEESKKKLADAEQAYNDASVNSSSPYADQFFSQVQDYQKSLETPERAAQRQKDQRNAAMWASVTDGINNIFNLTHAATNAYAQPQQLASTSDAIRAAADKADERYEKQQARLAQMNQTMAGLDMQQRQARIAQLKQQVDNARAGVTAAQAQENADRKYNFDVQEANRSQQNFERTQVETEKQHEIQNENADKDRKQRLQIADDDRQARTTQATEDRQAKVDAAKAEAARKAAEKNSVEINAGSAGVVRVPNGGMSEVIKKMPADVQKKINKAVKNYQDDHEGRIGTDKYNEIAKQIIEDHLRNNPNDAALIGAKPRIEGF